jgi:hypothetical protein
MGLEEKTDGFTGSYEEPEEKDELYVFLLIGQVMHSFAYKSYNSVRQ